MENKHYFHRVSELTPTRFWINNVTKWQARKAIEEGAIGCTQNPAYLWKMLTNDDGIAHAEEVVKRNMSLYEDDNDVILASQRDLVGEIAEIFMPLYEQSNGKQGYVSIQGDPFHEDYETIVKNALFNREKGLNIMNKIPVTVEGLKAIEYLSAQGCPINATEVMTVRQALDVCDVYKRATKGVKNKAPIYFSHITGILDQYLQQYCSKNNIDISKDILWQAGVAAAKKTYHMAKQRNPEVGFIGGGARGLQHFTEMVGGDVNITINWQNTADKLIELDLPVVERFNQPTPDYVIDTLVSKIDDYRKAYEVNAIEPQEYEEFGPVVLFRKSFEDAWTNSLQYINNLR